MLVAIHLLPLLLLSFCVQSGLAQNFGRATFIVNSYYPNNKTMFLAAQNKVDSSLVMLEQCDEIHLCSWIFTKQNQIVLSSTSLALTYFPNESCNENLKLTPLTNDTTQQFVYNATSLTLASAAVNHTVLDVLKKNQNNNAKVGLYKANQGWNQKFLLMEKRSFSHGPVVLH